MKKLLITLVIIAGVSPFVMDAFGRRTITVNPGSGGLRAPNYSNPAFWWGRSSTSQGNTNNQQVSTEVVL